MKLAVSLLAVLFPVLTSAATFSTDVGSTVFFIDVVGEIARGDAKKVDEIVDGYKVKKSNYEPLRLFVRLDSKGGDVQESIKIGRKIRSHEARVSVVRDGSCFSSCVFLLAGGVERLIAGKVGIHRPYFSDLSPSMSTSEIRKERERLLKEIRTYLTEVDVPLHLLDEMLSIPPEDLKILSYEELSRYRLSGDDPTYNEKETAELADRYGITSAEYRKRKAVANLECARLDQLSAQIRCEERILFGLTSYEFDLRRKEFNSKCSSDASNVRIGCYFRIMRQ